MDERALERALGHALRAAQRTKSNDELLGVVAHYRNKIYQLYLPQGREYASLQAIAHAQTLHYIMQIEREVPHEHAV